MPLATNQAWLKSYGNLPWWRSGASYSGEEYPKALGSSSVRRYARPKNGKRYEFDASVWRVYAQCASLSGVEFVDGNVGHGPCSRCGYKDQTREGVCFGCFLTFGGPMKSWEAKMLGGWKKENPGWTGQRLAMSKIVQDAQRYDFDESLHPRDEKGRFGDSEGSGVDGKYQYQKVNEAKGSIDPVKPGSRIKYQKGDLNSTMLAAVRLSASNGDKPYFVQSTHSGFHLSTEQPSPIFQHYRIVGRVIELHKPAVLEHSHNPVEEHIYQVALSREPTAYEKRVDFAAIVTGLDHLEAQGLARIRVLLAAARDRLLSLVGRKLGENRLTTKFVNDLELRGLGQLVPTLREVMRTAFRQGEQGAKDELKQAQSVGGKKLKSLSRNDPAWGIKAIMLAAMEEHPDWTGEQIVAEVKETLDVRSYQVRHTLEGLPPEKALEFFEQKALLWGADIRDPLLSDIKNILFDAIKMGRPLRDIQAELSAAFLPWLGDPNQLIDEETLTPYRLETLVRTNVNEALNEGRKAMFQPEVDSGFITAFQYSAILDKRTTEVCRYLDRKMFAGDSPELDRLSPPRHYNCFVDGQTPIYTVQGWKSIGSLERGDLVLTHHGRFQPVTFVHHKENPQQYSAEVVKIIVEKKNTGSSHGKSVEHFITVTPEHPVLRNSKWVAAQDIQVGDRIGCLGSACQTCGKIMPWLTTLAQKSALTSCGRSCFAKRVFKDIWADPEWRKRNSESARAQMLREYASGTRDRKAITKAANEKTRELIAAGKSPIQRPEVREKCVKAAHESPKFKYAVGEGQRGDKYFRGKRTREQAYMRGKQLAAFLAKNPERHGNCIMGKAVLAGHEGYLSKGQRKLYALAQQLQQGLVEIEYPVKAGDKTFYLDVALPELQCGLEFDGSYWHQDIDKDSTRDKMLADEGWKIIRYRDHVPSLEHLQRDIGQLAANHAQSFVWTDVEVVKIEKWTLRKPRRLYNISVHEDESYVAKGFVVHNCRSLLIPVTRADGPVQFIRADEVAKGVLLSGKGFCEGQDVHACNGVDYA